MREMTIGKNDAGQRLDKFLQKALPSLPPSLMHKYVRLKRIKCNGKRCQTSDRLTEGDVLSLYINDEFFQPAKEEEAFRRITPRLHVLYEDDHILLCDKRPGMVVHEDDQGTLDTLINHIKAYLYEKGEWDPDKERSFTPALCNGSTGTPAALSWPPRQQKGCGCSTKRSGCTRCTNSTFAWFMAPHPPGRPSFRIPF